MCSSYGPLMNYPKIINQNFAFNDQVLAILKRLRRTLFDEFTGSSGFNEAASSFWYLGHPNWPKQLHSICTSFSTARRTKTKHVVSFFADPAKVCCLMQNLWQVVWSGSPLGRGTQWRSLGHSLFAWPSQRSAISVHFNERWFGSLFLCRRFSMILPGSSCPALKSYQFEHSPYCID